MIKLEELFYLFCTEDLNIVQENNIEHNVILQFLGEMRMSRKALQWTRQLHWRDLQLESAHRYQENRKGLNFYLISSSFSTSTHLHIILVKSFQQFYYASRINRI